MSFRFDGVECQPHCIGNCKCKYYFNTNNLKNVRDMQEKYTFHFPVLFFFTYSWRPKLTICTFLWQKSMHAKRIGSGTKLALKENACLPYVCIYYKTVFGICNVWYILCSANIFSTRWKAKFVHFVAKIEPKCKKMKLPLLHCFGGDNTVKTPFSPVHNTILMMQNGYFANTLFNNLLFHS